MPLITRKTAADLLGLSVRRVGQIVEEGNGPPQARGGSFPAREFGQWMVERELAKHGRVGGDDLNGRTLDLTNERARLAKAQADKTELEVAELHGEMVRVPEVTEAWSKHIAAARARLLALPSKAAARVAAPALLAETQELLRGIVDEALNELAGDGLPERTRARIARAAGVARTAPADSERVGGSGKDAKPRGKRRAGKVDDGAG